MDDRDILKAFKEKVCHEVEIEKQGLDRYVVYTPFAFDDGDHYVVLLKRERDRWLLTDEGHTFMHLSYGGVDVLSGQRGELVKESLVAAGLENRAGELVLDVPDEQFGAAVTNHPTGSSCGPALGCGRQSPGAADRRSSGQDTRVQRGSGLGGFGLVLD
jgi:hypothetical protein